MKNKPFIIILSVLVLCCFSCKNDRNKPYDPDVVKSYQNKEIQSINIDSTKTVQLIIKQKLQEVFDLATLHQNYYKDESVDTILINQIYSYFLNQDSTMIHPYFKTIDSLKVKQLVVGNVVTLADSIGADSVGAASFDLSYYLSGNQLIKESKENMTYVLRRKSSTDSLFHFYIQDLKSLNDTIPPGQTQ